MFLALTVEYPIAPEISSSLFDTKCCLLRIKKKKKIQLLYVFQMNYNLKYPEHHPVQ